jgi:transcriptional regulator with XRE-family HTH domain
MTPHEFKSWKLRLGLTWSAAAEALGISPRLGMKYASGENPVPKPIAKLCDYLEQERNGK